MVLNIELEDLWAKEQVQPRHEDMHADKPWGHRKGTRRWPAMSHHPFSLPTSAQRLSKQCPRRLNLVLLLAEESSCQARFLNISISSAIIFSFQNRHGPIIFFRDCFPLCLKAPDTSSLVLKNAITSNQEKKT